MDIAALIVGSISLLFSTAVFAILVGKVFLSTHKVQMVPLDSPFDIGSGKPGYSPYTDIEEPLDDKN